MPSATSNNSNKDRTEHELTLRLQKQLPTSRHCETRALPSVSRAKYLVAPQLPLPPTFNNNLHLTHATQQHV